MRRLDYTQLVKPSFMEYRPHLGINETVRWWSQPPATWKEFHVPLPGTERDRYVRVYSSKASINQATPPPPPATTVPDKPIDSRSQSRTDEAK
jgi:hypothetical protein